MLHGRTCVQRGGETLCSAEWREMFQRGEETLRAVERRWSSANLRFKGGLHGAGKSANLRFKGGCPRRGKKKTQGLLHGAGKAPQRGTEAREDAHSGGRDAPHGGGGAPQRGR